MTLKIYTVFDSKVGAYMRPFFLQSKGEALRSWVDIANDPQSGINKHPEDYTLFEIGEWSDVDAKFVEHKAPISLGVAIEVHKTYNISSLTPQSREQNATI